MLTKYQYEKLLDSLKLISRSIHVMAKETNDSNRAEAELLASDLVDRMFRDIKEMVDGFVPDSHTGHIDTVLKEKKWFH